MSGSKQQVAARLAELARIWRTGLDNDTWVVPVVGSGFTIQAAAQAQGGREDDWAGLLQRIVESFDVPRQALENLPSSFIQQWETIVRATALHGRGWKPFAAEKDLQSEVKSYLSDLEDRTASYPLYRRFVAAGFRDIISLNFDRRLALSHGARKVYTGGKVYPPGPLLELSRKTGDFRGPLFSSKNKEVGVHGKTLFRHSLVKEGARGTRIWYPHGDSSLASSIKLGVRAYGLYIAKMEHLREQYMREWSAASDRYDSEIAEEWVLPPGEWDPAVRVWNHSSWVYVFLSAPLVFLGCGLGPDEWGLWWLLHQRARHTTYLEQKEWPKRPDTVILTAGEQPPAHLAGSPAFVEVLNFPTYGDLWEAVEENLIEGS